MPNCRKFRRLCLEREDRELRPRETAFVDSHREACDPCRIQEAASVNSLNMLRAITMTVQPSDSYDSKLVRRVKIDRGRDRFAYWFPGIVSAGIASFAMFALLQLVTSSHPVKPFIDRSAGAQNFAAPDQIEPRLLLAPEAPRSITR
ncbi:MAG TPA: hypothetical protein VKT78_00050 [Fimbriimonadaceae bacterium]|nr:hypothetical protein [Fimbriimonadaceae bacterium]